MRADNDRIYLDFLTFADLEKMKTGRVSSDSAAAAKNANKRYIIVTFEDQG